MTQRRKAVLRLQHLERELQKGRVPELRVPTPGAFELYRKYNVEPTIVPGYGMPKDLVRKIRRKRTVERYRGKVRVQSLDKALALLPKEDENMPSTSIYIRLSNTTLAGALLLVGRGGRDVSTQPISTSVRQLLTAIVKDSQNKGLVPHLNEEAAAKILAEVRQDEVEAPNLDFLQYLSDPDEDERSAPSERESPDDAIKKLARETADEISGRSVPNVRQQVEVHEELSPPPDGLETLSEYAYLSLEEIKSSRPEDPLVLAFEENPPKNERQRALFQRCIEIVYNQTPVEQWGTQRTNSAVSELYQDHL